MPADFTPADYRVLRRMSVTLDDPLDGLQSATERLYNTVVTAYQRLDDECAAAHRAEREARKWRNRLGWALAIVAGIAIAEGWVIWK